MLRDTSKLTVLAAFCAWHRARTDSGAVQLFVLLAAFTVHQLNNDSRTGRNVALA